MSSEKQASPDYVLSADRVCKAFDGVPVLRDLSFSLRRNEALGIIGPSGSGKSTTLRCIDLLETIDSGQITWPGVFSVRSDPIDGLVVSTPTSAPTRSSESTLANVRRRMGLVFQGFHLWEDRTVLDNLTLAPRVVLARDKREVEDKAVTLCREFGLEGRLSAPAWQLSGGQKQRVAILRALMMEPEILLLDEITSALDPVLTVDVMAMIRELRAAGLSMLVVSHHIEFVSSLCNRVMFLDQGAVVQIDTPEALRASPATNEVKRFLEIVTSAR